MQDIIFKRKLQFFSSGSIPAAFQVLLKVINLEKYYPQKLTPTDAVCIRQETLGSLQYKEQPELLPYFLMQKIIMCNYECRANILCIPQNIADSDSNSDDNDTNSDPEDLVHLRLMTLNDVHPMDGLLALMHCTDNFLRQDLMAKLSTCKLAIPFLLPDPKAQTLTFPLWAMRSIVKEWKSKGRDMECRIVDYKTPIVSFLRFSESEISNSKILNDVIGDSEHDFFFHWECEGGSAKRILVDGLVELCWHLPEGKESDHFPDIVTFTNLYGDARKHNQQATFLSQVSFMNFVLLTQRDIEDYNGVKLLQELAKVPGGLVLMFSDAKEDDRVKIPKETLQKDMYRRVKLKGKKAATIKSEICCQITWKLDQHAQHPEKVSEQLRLTECAGTARRIGIYVDEDNENCKKGKQLAIVLVTKIRSLDTVPDSTASVKKRMLPLQSPELWHEWAKHDKEQHRHINRGSRGIEQYNSEKEKEKIAIRREQFKQADPPTPVMRLFILSLLQYKGSIRDYFLQWLKILLDDRSRDMLPGLNGQYKTKRKELNKLKDQQDADPLILTTRTSQLQKLNEQLLHTSFGFEHLLRELGQMYESVCEVSKLRTLDSHQHDQWQMFTVSKHLQSQVCQLPQVAAELLITGYPLELMDRDASHMPLTWVCSVLDKVKEMLGNKQLFILSVLGIQGTGKSTLMSAMFGLQFTVSAGRCTQGAFIHLLPINEQLRADIKCDYFLVVDTEGLCAPELDSVDTQKHDNEMATFVIGLADVTIINIFGEAPGDMDDILQTAVHAFLRMKKVKLKPSCQFVHQNVAVSTATKGRMRRNRFYEKLDEMTRAAAKEEQCERRYQSFKDVISFDDEKDIWYFPSLWIGDPPMAPVNPGYSDKAQELKSGIIALAREKGYHCTILEFQSRVKQLWEAVLNENFVFSFKNTSEITVADLCIEGEKRAEEHCRTLICSQEAYASIDKMRASHCEELRKHVQELVSKLEGRKLTETEQKSMFEDKWGEWMQAFTAKLPSKVYQADVDVHTSIVDCLRNLLPKHDHKIISELRHIPLQNRGKPLKLTIQPDKHLRSCRWGGIKHLLIDEFAYAETQNGTFMETAKKYLEDLKKRHIQYFTIGFITNLFNKLFESVNQFNQGNPTFKFTQEYKVDVALTVGGYALHQFEEMLTVIRKENDPIEYLKTLEIPFFNTFKSQYSQIAKEKTAADNLCYLLKTPIVTAVTKSLGCLIAIDMKAKLRFHTKRALKAQILWDLGERKIFKDFVLYITDAKASMQKWVQFYTKEHCSKSIDGKSRLEELAIAKLQEIIISVNEAVVDATKSLPLPKKANINDWLRKVHRRLNLVLALNPKEIKEVIGVEDLNDFHYFTQEVIKGLRKMECSLLEDFQCSPFSQMDSWLEQPYDILCDDLLGCFEQCPLCGEQCELTTPNHDCKHSVALHRPQCLGGCTSTSTGKMMLETCSSSVASNMNFQNAATGHKSYPYRQYQMFYPNWIITPDSLHKASSYWKWFVANYSAQIAKHFNMKETQVPDTWKSLTWEEVKRDLKTLYNL